MSNKQQSMTQNPITNQSNNQTSNIQNNTSQEYIMEQNNAKNETNFELAHIIGLNANVFNCVQAHPSMIETISYCVGGIIITEDLMERNNQVFFRHGSNQISAFKISNSGRLLAVGFTTSNLDKSLPANIIIWDYENKKVLYELTGINKAVKAIEFSPDDRFISAYGVDNSFFIWDCLTGTKCYHRIFEFNMSMVKWVRMVYEENSKHPNYSIILSNVNNIFHYYFFFELKAMQYNMQCNKFSLPSSGFVRTFLSCVYDYNTKTLLVGTAGGEICLFSIDKHIYKGSFNAIKNGLNHIIINNDSSIIISGGDGKIKKLSLNTDNNDFKYVLNYEIELNFYINSLSLSADKNEVIAATSNGEIYRILNIDLSFALHNDNHFSSVNQCCFSNDNENFYSVDNYGNVVNWELNDYTVVSKLNGNGKDGACSVKLAEDGTILIGYSNGVLRNYDNKLTSLIWEITAHRGKINCIYVDGNYILTGGEDGIIRVWTRKTHELVMQFSAHHKEVHSLFADRNMPNIIYSGGEDKTMNCFDLKLQKRVIVHNMKNGFIFDMDQKHDGDKEIISVGFNSGLCIWDFFKIEPVVEMELGKNFFSLKISNNGKFVAMGSETGEIWIMTVNDLRLVGKSSGHSQRVISIAWSPDDKQIISTSFDFSVSIWNFYLN